MQIAPIPTLDDETNQIRMMTADIVANHIIPNEHFLRRRDSDTPQRWGKLMNLVKEAGLWAPHLPEEYGGMGIGFLKLAYMNEILAWSPYSNPIFGILAPNSGNQKILIKYGTPEQKKKWLEPLVDGSMQSCFAMTEPDEPGSDPRSLKTRAIRDGDEWVINGHKWFASNAKAAHFAIVMCRTEEGDGSGGVNDKMTQIIVPKDTPGFNVIRSVPVWGHEGGHHGEIIFDNCRVPLENQLGRSGSGHQAAQDRLGAGRVYHCMNCVGQMWRAFDMMVRRSMEREVHGGLLGDQAIHSGIHRGLLHGHPVFAPDDHPLRRGDGEWWRCADRDLGHQGLRARSDGAGRRSRHPGARRPRRIERHTARGDVPGSPYAAPRGWPR